LAGFPCKLIRGPFSKIIVDTTVQEKAVAFPTDAKLMHRARERLARLAKKHGVALQQSYERIGKHALIAHQRYAHAKQFAQARRCANCARFWGASSATSPGGSKAMKACAMCSAPRSISPSACASSAKGSAARRSIRCMRPRSNASARERRRVTEQIKRELRRRSAVEPVIGHLKTDHRMGRNFLANAAGDAANAVLAAAAYNFWRPLTWLALLCAFLLGAFS
jgi:hypothetical protein